VVINPEDNSISVWNNGRGIPVEMHKEEKCWVPELIFGHCKLLNPTIAITAMYVYIHECMHYTTMNVLVHKEERCCVPELIFGHCE
jgi:hypothetical protein